MVLVGAETLLRCAVYGVRLLLLILLATGILTLYSWRPRTVSTAPSFRIVASDWATRAGNDEVTTNGWFGRSETRRYGRIYDRDRDMAVILSMPLGGWSGTADFVREIASIQTMRGTRGAILPTYHDLETRFGPLRAAEMRVEADGRTKLCLAFASRFDTEAVSLKGWVCEASGARPSPNALACAINTLTLDGRLASADADRFLRDRLARPGPCYASPVTQTTDTRQSRPRTRRW